MDVITYPCWAPVVPGDMSSLEERLHQLEMPHDLYRRGVYSRRRASLDSDPNYPPRPRSAASSVVSQDSSH